MLNDKTESPSKLTTDWGVYGEMESGARVPIGTYSCYAKARLAGNTWLASTPKGASWHAERLYVPLTHEEHVEA